MNNNRPTGPRKERTVRLSDHEWDTARALAALSGESSSAGLGIRSLIRAEEGRLRASGRGDELDLILAGLSAGRDA